MNFLQNILNSSEDRTHNIKVNIFLSFVNKGLSVVISFLLVSLTIKYVNKEQYGIWLALSSVVGWMSFFDFGLTHGLRNKFAEAKAMGDTKLARQYVSTTYFVLTVIFGIICVLGCIINSYLNWSKILNLSITLNPTLTSVFYVLISSFCVQLILNILTTIITADQKPALAAFINTIGQFFVLLVIIILLNTSTGTLFKLSFAVCVVPCIIYLIASIFFYSKSYKNYAPNRNSINLKLIGDILSLGGKFFVIQLSMIFVFQMINIILMRILGAESVTTYNIAYKYFSVIYMVTVIIINPLWSAFTDAFFKNDYDWMKKIYSKLSKIWFITIPVTFIMVLLANFIYRLWVGNDIHIPIDVSIVMAVYILFLSRANLSMYLINGTGKISIQMYIYIFFGIISIPLMITLCKDFGINGILFVVTLQCIFQCFFGEIQIRKILKNSAKGIWNK